LEIVLLYQVNSFAWILRLAPFRIPSTLCLVDARAGVSGVHRRSINLTIRFTSPQVTHRITARPEQAMRLLWSNSMLQICRLSVPGKCQRLNRGKIVILEALLPSSRQR